MTEEMRLPTKEDLAKLTLRAMAAYAARCARRVQPLFEAIKARLGAETSFAVERGISLAERFAQTTATPDVESVTKAAEDVNAAANAAADAGRPYLPAHSAAYSAAEATAYAICAAYGVAAPEAVPTPVAAARAAKAARAAYDSDALIKACIHDYRILRQLSGHASGTLGDPIDSESLGPLWPEGEPEWFSAGDTVGPAGLALGEDETHTTPGIEIYIDPGNASKETIQEVLECLSDLHIAEGGLGLEFVADDLEIHAMEGIKS
jgi:hypothetical protein